MRVISVHLSNPLATIAKHISNQRVTGEIGVGDTLERLISDSKLDKIAKVYEKITGKSCGCVDRKKWLNTKYPYL